MQKTCLLLAAAAFVFYLSSCVPPKRPPALGSVSYGSVSYAGSPAAPRLPASLRVSPAAQSGGVDCFVVEDRITGSRFLVVSDHTFDLEVVLIPLGRRDWQGQELRLGRTERSRYITADTKIDTKTGT